MDHLSPEPRCCTSGRQPCRLRRPECLPAALPAALLITLLAAACGAQAQERTRVAAVTYTLGSTSVPQQGEQSEHRRLEVVRWAAQGDSAWGMSLGASRDGLNPPRPEVGVRWRSRLEGNQRLDLSAWRRITANGAAASPEAQDEAALQTRIELQFTSPRSSASLGELGALGVQLGADSKLSMRVRRGGPMLYYRMQF
ncbi:hypothetical protein [Azohydromonas lata]|uniref:Uncharacterized protein n=1 Tax=Azohydromonas lata TaxID=45677 RepID=A0ABU5IQS7_9BURK|nr:hypothetical protein [Azohydromonas lata]MDZ5461257.1 hypothetical protein [Azohydromonas lata]